MQVEGTAKAPLGVSVAVCTSNLRKKVEKNHWKASKTKKKIFGSFCSFLICKMRVRGIPTSLLPQVLKIKTKQ